MWVKNERLKSCYFNLRCLIETQKKETCTNICSSKAKVYIFPLWTISRLNVDDGKKVKWAAIAFRQLVASVT